MKRIATWFLSTVTVVVLMFGYHTSTNSTLSATSQPAFVGSSSTSGSTSSTTKSNGGSTGNSNSNGNTTSSSSTVTGDVAQTRWGPVQVELTVANGSITDVSVLQYPSGNGKDQQINARALPVLIQETLDAQNATIDMVSGATVTSEGYLESLQSALDKAGLS